MPAKKIIFCPLCGYRIHGPLTTRPTTGPGFASFWKCGNPSCFYFAVSSDYQRPFEPYMWGNPIRITALDRTDQFTPEEIVSVIKTTLAMFTYSTYAIPEVTDRIEVMGRLTNDV